MTKEEYKAELEELRRQEKEIHNKKDALEDAYLNEHLTVGPGDKVKIIYDDWHRTVEAIAFISSSRVGSDGTIIHHYIKTKKDGSPSSHQLRLYGKVPTSIQLIEKAKQS